VLLSMNEMEAELSYAYLHAVASRAGFACDIAGRQSDRAGIDARVHVKERLARNASFTDFSIEIQLNATSRHTTVLKEHYSYWLKSDHYEKLRNPGVWSLRFLVVLLLPEDPTQWLSHDDDGMTSRKCAYWVSLRGALPSDNVTGQTVYIPRANRFSHDGLRALATRFACQEVFAYVVR
jgi:hypothetical protein